MLNSNMSFGFPSIQILVPTYKAHPEGFKLFQFLKFLEGKFSRSHLDCVLL